jgi:Leucine-rich repeat (LRR) protein
MQAIEFLSLEYNQLTETIPLSLFRTNLAGLLILYLNDNDLRGTVTENYGTRVQLKDLWLSNIAKGNLLF